MTTPNEQPIYLDNDKLLSLAEQCPPPQSFYDEPGMPAPLTDAEIAAFRELIASLYDRYLVNLAARNLADRLAAEVQEKRVVVRQLMDALSVRDAQLAAANERIAELESTAGHLAVTRKIAAERDQLRQQLAEREGECEHLKKELDRLTRY